MGDSNGEPLSRSCWSWLLPQAATQSPTKLRALSSQGRELCSWLPSHLRQGLAGCFEFPFLTNTCLPSLLGSPVPWMRSCPWAVPCSVEGCLPDLGAGKGDSGTSKQGQGRKLIRSQRWEPASLTDGITREHKPMHLPVAKILGCRLGGCFVRGQELGPPFVLPTPEIQQGLEQATPQPGNFPAPARYFVTNSVFSCPQEPFPITSQQTSVNTWGAEVKINICLVLGRLSPAPQAESPQFQGVRQRWEGAEVSVTKDGLYCKRSRLPCPMVNNYI